jgi:hypothetical protein
MFVKPSQIRKVMKNSLKSQATFVSKEASVYTAIKVEELITNLTVFAEEHTKSLNKQIIKAENIASVLDKISLILKIYPKRGDEVIFLPPKKELKQPKDLKNSEDREQTEVEGYDSALNCQ